MYAYVYVKSTHAAMGKQFSFTNDKRVLADLPFRLLEMNHR